MTAYIVRRLFAVVPVMAVVALFVFFLLRFAPGDPAAIIAGEDATAEAIAAMRAKLGLDRPMVEQFVVWVWGLVQGDLGVSIFSNLAGHAADRAAARADAGAHAVDAVRRRGARHPDRRASPPGRRASWSIGWSWASPCWASPCRCSCWPTC